MIRIGSRFNRRLPKRLRPDTPGQIDGLTAWYRGDEVVLSGGAVSSWVDKSGNGRNLSQSTAANRPTQTTTLRLNNQSVLSFDGSNDLLTGPLTSAIIAADQHTIFAVVIPDTIDGNSNTASFDNGIITDDSSNFGIFFRALQGAFAVSATPVTGLYTPGTPAIVTSRMGSGTIKYGRNRITETSGATANTTITGTVRVGANGAGTRMFKGIIAEIIVYNKNLSDTDRNTILTYLEQRYALGQYQPPYRTSKTLLGWYDPRVWNEGNWAVTLGTMGAVTSSGTTPPTLTLTGTQSQLLNIRVECIGAGTDVTATLRYSFDNGTTWWGNTSPATGFTSFGVTASWPAGVYVTDQVWASKGRITAFPSREDSSGTVTASRTVSQGTAAQQPTFELQSSSYNRCPVMNVATSQAISNTTFPTQAQPYTMIAHGRVGGTNRNFFRAVNGGVEIGLITNGANLVGVYGGASLITATSWVSAKRIVAGVFNSTSGKAYVDTDSSPTTGNVGTNPINSTTSFVLGAAASTGTGAINEDFATLMIFNGELSATEIDTIGEWLEAEYASTWT